MDRVVRSTRVFETPLGRFGVEATSAGVARIRLPGDPSLPDADIGGDAIDPSPPEAGAEGDAAAPVLAHVVAAQIEEYACGERERFEAPLDWAGLTAEHRRVLETLLAIAPYGHTVTYGELGARAGVDDPRDVGVHMNRNPFPIVVPCHRVVAADGLGGYGGGLVLKRRLLELEGALPPSLDLGDL